MKNRKEALAAAYERFHGELSSLLYEIDPASMGASIGAPKDEYDGMAARLAAALKDLKHDTEVDALLFQILGVRDQTLVAGVAKALRRFKLDAETAIRTQGPAR
jgi:hypothetical protein